MPCLPRPCIVCGDVFTPLQERKKKCGKSYCYAIPKIKKRLAEGRCRGCGISLPDSAFKSCVRCKKYQADFVREKLRKEKLQLIAAYGGRCSCCGEDEPKFLSIDHIHNDGAAERSAMFGSRDKGGYANQKFYRWLRSQDYPKDRYQLLCYNCNCAKGFWGQCPHSQFPTK